MKIKRLDHFVITVKDINKTIDFYAKILNLEVVTLQWKDITIKALKFGEQRINIHEAGKEIEPKALKATPGSADICFITDSPIAEIENHLKNNKVNIEKKPMIVLGALGEMESVWFRDPDGNLIEVSCYLA